jgi:hypothetical protein
MGRGIRKDPMRKANLRDRFRVVDTLEDGRKRYLSTRRKLLVMPRVEAEFWAGVARQVQGVTVDEMVYSKDLRYYERRSYFLERLVPFSRVVKKALEQTSVAPDPAAFMIGGVPAAEVDFQFRPRHDYSNSVLIIC